MNKIKNDFIIPYSGFEIGYNVIVYNSNKLKHIFNTFKEVLGMTRLDARMHTLLIRDGGYTVVMTTDDNFLAEQIRISLVEEDLQAEVLFDDGADDDFNEENN